jgi:hypothetical protein
MTEVKGFSSSLFPDLRRRSKAGYGGARSPLQSRAYFTGQTPSLRRRFSTCYRLGVPSPAFIPGLNAKKPLHARCENG